MDKKEIILKLSALRDAQELSNSELVHVIDGLEAQTFWFWVKRIIGLALTVVIVMMAGCPSYNVWQQGMSGRAELKRAEQNRQILINEAKALMESSKFRADAEIERARGIDEANKVIAQSLGGPEGYLRYLYIDALQATSCSIVYVPTEAGLPITEAVRFNTVNK